MENHLWEKVGDVLEYINTQNMGVMGYKDLKLFKQHEW